MKLKFDEQQTKEIIEKYISGISSEKIAKEYLVNGSTICRILKKNLVQIRPSSENKLKYKYDKNFFEKINTPRLAYFLGLMYSDGSVSNKGDCMKICLLKTDENVLAEFSKDMLGIEKLTHWETKNNTQMTTFHYYCAKMKEDLIKHGCMPDKAFKIRLPNLNDELMLHFIRGMFCGDGCINVNSNKTRIRVIITTNIDFANDLGKYMKDKYEISHTIRKYKHTKAVDIVFGKTKEIFKMLELLYKDSNGLYINRKYEKYIDYKNLYEEKQKIKSKAK